MSEAMCGQDARRMEVKNAFWTTLIVGFIAIGVWLIIK